MVNTFHVALHLNGWDCLGGYVEKESESASGLSGRVPWVKEKRDVVHVPYICHPDPFVFTSPWSSESLRVMMECRAS